MVEVAVSSILLVVSGLMIRSIVQNSRIDMPFATEDVLVTSLLLDNRAYPAAAEISRGLQQVEQELSALSGIRAFALSTGVPRSGGNALVEVEGESYDSADDYARSGSIVNGPAYFDVLRVRPTQGRTFTPQDVDTSLPVAIVDESFVRQYLQGSAIGRRIRFGSETDKGVSFDNAKWLTVVGVVPQLVLDQYDGRQTAQIFRPLAAGHVAGRRGRPSGPGAWLAPGNPHGRTAARRISTGPNRVHRHRRDVVAQRVCGVSRARAACRIGRPDGGVAH
jgi:hypothetical protein